MCQLSRCRPDRADATPVCSGTDTDGGICIATRRPAGRAFGMSVFQSISASRRAESDSSRARSTGSSCPCCEVLEAAGNRFAGLLRLAMLYHAWTGNERAGACTSL